VQRRAAIAVPIVVAVLLAAAGSARAADPFAITGYALGNPAEVARGAATVSDVGIDGATISADGSRIVTYPELHEALEAAHDAGRPASLLLANFHDGDFSPAVGRRLLRDPGNRAAVVGQLADEVAEAGWDGVTVDIENIRAGDRAGLVEFVIALRSALPGGTSLDIDVPATTDPDGWAWEPFDLPTLADHVDHVTVMAYDQHYSTGPPGPIAGIRWVRRSLKTILDQVAPGQLRLGVPGWGFLWRGDARPARVLSVAQARELAGRRARWSKAAAEWHARLGHGRELWFADARSMRKRIALARGAGLDGAAIWRLGLADRITPDVAGGPVLRADGT